MKIGITDLKPTVRLATAKQIELMKTLGLDIKPGLTLNEARKIIGNEIEERRGSYDGYDDYADWCHDPYY